MPGTNVEDTEYEEEVDPTVYLKCRLCLIEDGAFPIQQTLQQQIQYCFDITIKPFDLQPQLICKKCKVVVKDFHTIKRTYIDNQDKIRQKLNLEKFSKPVNEPTAQHASAQSETTADVEAEDDILQDQDQFQQDEVASSKSKAKNRKNMILSHSSDSDVEALPDTETVKNNAPEYVRKDSMTWKKSYDEYFICKYCKVPLRTRQLIIKHVKTHAALLNRSHKYIKRHCRITLEKIDTNLNLTGDPKTVVISPNNIIYDEGHKDYYIKYLPIGASIVLIDQNSTRSKSKTLKRIKYFDDSSDDEFERKPRNKRRKTSRSSSRDTVVLDGNDSTAKTTKPDPPGDSDIMYIDDSSSDAFETNTRKKQKLNSTGTELRAKIKGIINECYTKYKDTMTNDVKKVKKDSRKNLEISPEEILNRKLLSVGRKLMHNKGLPTQGLVGYLKKKNVHVNWFPHVGNKKNCVRIITAINYYGKRDDWNNWSVVKPNENFEDTPVAEDAAPDAQPREVAVTPLAPFTNTNIMQIAPVPTAVAAATTNTTDITPNVALSSPQPATSQNNVHEDIQTNYDSRAHKQNIGEMNVQNYMFGEQDPSETDSLLRNKLLNANPVANPKQLPKRPNAFTECLQEFMSAHSMPDLDDIRPETETFMPIIASTMSLAEPPPPQGLPEDSNTTTSAEINDSTNRQDAAYPRIKCKPVSELLAWRPAEPPAAPPSPAASVSIAVGPPAAPLPLRIVSVSAAPAAAVAQARAAAPRVTLNSVHLPNMSTSQPIEYLKQCLNMHNITLLTKLGTKVAQPFTALIKFRLDISLNDQSIVLNLSLFGHASAFCLKLKNPRGEDLDIDNLPAHWQLHILRSFQNNDVAMKLLNAAGKVGRALNENATKFMTILRDIETVK